MTPLVKHKPEPAAVVAAYHRNVAAHGKRGAYRRVGDAFGISDQSVIRYVQADEAQGKVVAPIDDDLAYLPCPGEVSYQAERDRLAAELAAQLPQPLTPQRHKPRLQCHRDSHNRLRRAVAVVGRETRHNPHSAAPVALQAPVANERHSHSANGEAAQPPYHWKPHDPPPPTRIVYRVVKPLAAPWYSRVYAAWWQHDYRNIIAGVVIWLFVLLWMALL